MAYNIVSKLNSGTAPTLAAFGKQTGSLLPTDQLNEFIFQFSTQSTLPGVSSSLITAKTTFIDFISAAYNFPTYPVLGIMADAAGDSSPLDAFKAKLTSAVFADPVKQSNLLAVIHDPSVYPSGFLPSSSIAKLITQFSDPNATIAQSAGVITPA